MKSIFITGAGSGMGYETARLFAGKGWRIGAVDVNPAGLRALAAEMGGEHIFTWTFDVFNRDAYKAALDAFASVTGGRLDILFNNAGIARSGPFSDMAWDDVMAVVGVNLLGVLSGIHLALPLLKATPGSLCFSTSSSSAIFGVSDIAVYSATKHAVKGFTEALSVEMKPYGVRVADTLPGLIDTPILPAQVKARADAAGMWRVIPAIEVAKVVWEAYHIDKIHWYVPEELADYDALVTREPEQIRDAMVARRAAAGTPIIGSVPSSG